MAKWLDFKHTHNLKGKLLFSTLGVISISLGIAVCRVGGVGVDPFTAMNIGISARIGMDLGTYQLIVNAIILVFVFIMDRMLIGPGTIINMVGVGYLVQFFTWLFDTFPLPGGFISAALHLIVGTLLFTLGVSLYLKTRMGVAPIDAIAPIAVERTRFGYTACRMTQDIVVAIIAIIAGGPIGIFTVVAAFFTGPFITMWNKILTLPLYRRFGILTQDEWTEEAA